jgi:hypothetical protein
LDHAGRPLIWGSDGRPANGYSIKLRSELSPEQVCHRRPGPHPALTSTEGDFRTNEDDLPETNKVVLVILGITAIAALVFLSIVEMARIATMIWREKIKPR